MLGVPGLPVAAASCRRAPRCVCVCVALLAARAWGRPLTLRGVLWCIFLAVHSAMRWPVMRE
jgi:hypothetical protein